MCVQTHYNSASNRSRRPGLVLMTKVNQFGSNKVMEYVSIDVGIIK